MFDSNVCLRFVNSWFGPGLHLGWVEGTCCNGGDGMEETYGYASNGDDCGSGCWCGEVGWEIEVVGLGDEVMRLLNVQEDKGREKWEKR